jgi:hypothetical protein
MIREFNEIFLFFLRHNSSTVKNSIIIRVHLCGRMRDFPGFKQLKFCWGLKEFSGDWRQV